MFYKWGNNNMIEPTMFCEVKLKDGRQGFVVEINYDLKACEIDFSNTNKDHPLDAVYFDEIEEII